LSSYFYETREEERQRATGKTSKVVIISAMRKLLNRVCSVTIHREHFRSAIARDDFGNGREFALDGPHGLAEGTPHMNPPRKCEVAIVDDGASVAATYAAYCWSF
jgi:hypothetical protein